MSSVRQFRQKLWHLNMSDVTCVCLNSRIKQSSLFRTYLLSCLIVLLLSMKQILDDHLLIALIQEKNQFRVCSNYTGSASLLVDKVMGQNLSEGQGF